MLIKGNILWTGQKQTQYSKYRHKEAAEWGEKEGPECFPGWCMSCLGQCSSDFEGYSVCDLLLYFYFPKTPLPMGQRTVNRDK